MARGAESDGHHRFPRQAGTRLIADQPDCQRTSQQMRPNQDARLTQRRTSRLLRERRTDDAFAAKRKQIEDMIRAAEAGYGE